MMLLIYPMLLVGYLLRRQFAVLVRRLPLPAAFISLGLLFGLLTETFAVLDNLAKPVGTRILLNQNPTLDLLEGVLYYGLFILAWYLLLRAYAFSKTQVFVLSGIFGILSEQAGAIALGSFTHPLTGILLALVVASVYGIFPFLAYLITEDRFAPRPRPGVRGLVWSVLAFFLFWATAGNFLALLNK